MYSHEFRKSLERELSGLAKKNPRQLEIIKKKIDEIVENPERYKNLRAPLQHLKRVHIDKSFVLVFSVKDKKVIFESVEHHDDIYE